MNEIIKEVNASHLGYMQEKLESLVKKSQDNKTIIETDSGIFYGKKQLRIFIYTNNLDVWNELINNLIGINELAIKDKPDGYIKQYSTRFNKDKDTRLYTIILNTDKYSLHYKFIYRTKI